MNNYQAAAAQAGFPPASPHAAGGHGGPQGRSFPAANSPGPIDMYSSSAAAAAAAAAADSAVASYVQAAASPQPPTTAFPAIAVSRAPLNYSPVSPLNTPPFVHRIGPLPIEKRKDKELVKVASAFHVQKLRIIQLIYLTCR